LASSDDSDARAAHNAGAIGGACGALVAIWGTRAFVALAPLDLPRRESIAVDWSIAATVIAILAASASLIFAGIGAKRCAVSMSKSGIDGPECC